VESGNHVLGRTEESGKLNLKKRPHLLTQQAISGYFFCVRPWAGPEEATEDAATVPAWRDHSLTGSDVE